MEITREDITHFLYEFEKQVGSKPELSYQKWPAWWFFSRAFFNDALPKQFTRYEKIIEHIRSGKPSRSSAKNYLYRKILALNEKAKMFLAGKPTSDSGSVLFFAHTNAIIEKDGKQNIDRIHQIVDLLRKKNYEPVFSVVSPFSHPASLTLRNFDMPYGYIDAQIKQKVKYAAKNLIKQYQSIVKTVVWDEKNASIFKQLKTTFDFYFSKEHLTIILFYYELYKKILSSKKVKLVISYAISDIAAKAIIAAAHDLGIQVLIVPHGLGMSKLRWNPPANVHLAAQNKKAQEVYSQAGYQHVHVMGSFFLPDILKHQQPSRTSRKILFITVPMVEYNFMDKEKYFALVQQLVTALLVPNTTLTIKLHPSEKHLQEYKKLVGKKPIKLITGKEKANLYDLISESEVVVGFPSTVLFEAAILDRMVIVLDLIQGEPLFVDPTLDADIGIITKQLTPSIVVDLLENTQLQEELREKRKRFLANYYEPYQERRFLDLIRELTQ